MSAATPALPHVLSSTRLRRTPIDFERINLTDLRKVARIWLEPAQSKLPREDLVKALRQALENDEAAGRVVRALSAPERSVVAVYRRYGGTVDGAVIRIDLLARGLLEVVENRITEHYTAKRWKHNPIETLKGKWVLLPDHSLYNYYSPYGYGRDPDKPFERLTLHSGVAQHVEPAGPAPWSIPPAEGTPHTVMRRAPAEVVLDLSLVFTAIAARSSVKVRRDGALAGPSLRALEKSLPLDDDSEYRLPDPHGLSFELLRQAGIAQVEGNAVRVDPAAATRQFSQPTAWQAYAWARGWLAARHWIDGFGALEAGELEHSADRVATARQVLAWALGCLAHAGDRWYDLNSFIASLHALQGETHLYLGYGHLAWDPKLTPPKAKENSEAVAQRRAGWFGREGAWFANALMVTLVSLGLVERSRMGRDAAAPHRFRLTALGRAVFGAPEVAPPPEEGEHRFLVIQPNFDVVAYLDQAGAAAAGLLGRLAESDSARSGTVRTFRLTRTSLYQAQESGLNHDQILDFLRRHSQREPPANVLHAIADWAGKRESLVLRSNVTLLAFPATEERDAFLKRHGGTACGERFALVPSRGKGLLKNARPLVSDHLSECRRTLELDEYGRIRTSEPTDIVQMARLRRIARPTPTGWQLTGDSIRQAAAAGLKPAMVHRWLEDHLIGPTPPLIDQAIDAWSGKGPPPLELDEAILLHVPDADQFRAIAQSPRLRPYLLGSPGPHWLAVARETRKELSAALEELGFSFLRHLTFGAFPVAGRDVGGDRDGR